MRPLKGWLDDENAKIPFIESTQLHVKAGVSTRYHLSNQAVKAASIPSHQFLL